MGFLFQELANKEEYVVQVWGVIFRIGISERMRRLGDEESSTLVAKERPDEGKGTGY